MNNSQYIPNRFNYRCVCICNLACFLLILPLFTHNLPAAILPVSQDTINSSATIEESNMPVIKSARSHSLYLGAGYGSNLLLAGSSISGNQPYISSDFAWSFKHGFWASVMVYNLPGVADSYLPLYDISVGYSRYLNKWFDISVSAATYRAAESMKEKLHDNFNYVTVSAGFDWIILYTRASAGYIPGETSTTYFFLRNSHYFETPPMGSRKSFFSFDPSINFLFGDHLRWELHEIPPPGGRPVRPGNEVYAWQMVNSFEGLQTELSLPISFNTGSFTFEVEPIYLIPLLSDKNYLSPGGFHFFLSLYFRLY